MKLEVLELTKAERAGLLEIVEKGRDWRMRHRAQTLLHFGDGLQAKAIATQQNLHLDTVYDRRKHWLTAGFSSLTDKHRRFKPFKPIAPMECAQAAIKTIASVSRFALPSQKAENPHAAGYLGLIPVN